MSRRAQIGACLVAAALLAGAFASALAGARARAGTARATAHLLVYAQEWSLWPSRQTLPAGRVGVQLWNRGQDAHDLRIRRIGSGGRLVGGVQGMSVTASGALRGATWHLAAGRYELYCSLPQHRRRGMHAVLRVR